MTCLRTRPRFAIDVAGDAATLVSSLRERIADADPPLGGDFDPAHCVLRIPASRRYIYSPAPPTVSPGRDPRAVTSALSDLENPLVRPRRGRGGAELALINIWAHFAEQGMLTVPMHNRLEGFREAGCHWGPLAWTSPRRGEAGPTPRHLAAARAHGAWVVECATRWGAQQKGHG